MPAMSHTLRDERGFTLPELLVAMTLTLVVLFATLQTLDVFSSNVAEQTRITDANDQVRSTMARAVADLRGASAVLRGRRRTWSTRCRRRRRPTASSGYASTTTCMQALKRCPACRCRPLPAPAQRSQI